MQKSFSPPAHPLKKRVERDRRRSADLAPLSRSGEGFGPGEKLDFCIALKKAKSGNASTARLWYNGD